MKLRSTPALAVVLLALVVALAAGSSYAAVQIGSKQIKNNSVKSVDVKDGALSGKDLKNESIGAGDIQNGTLTGADVQDDGLTGADVADGSLTSNDFTRGCPTSALMVSGVCIDKASTGTAGTLAAALADCDARRGRLMTHQEFKVLVTKPGIVWANNNVSNYEVLDLQDISGTTVVSQAIAFGGALFGPGVDVGATFYHRCVTYP